MTRTRPAALLLAAALLGGCSLTGSLENAPQPDENAPPNMAAALLADAPGELPLPASFSIALEVKLNASQQRGSVAQKDGMTIYYFAPENGGETYAAVPEKELARYSRLVLGRTAGGECVVQNFFAATGRVHTEPFATSAQGCGRFALDGGARYRRWFSYDEEGNFERVVLNDMMPGLVVHNYEYQAGTQTLTRIDFSQGARIIHTRQRRAARLGEGGRSEYPQDGALHTEILDVDSAAGTETFTRVIHGQSATVSAFAGGELQHHDSAAEGAPATRRTAADAESNEAFAAELLAIRAAIAAAQQDINFFKDDQPLR